MNSIGLSTLTNFTFLAPNNHAFNEVLNTMLDASAADSALLNAVFSWVTRHELYDIA